MGPEQLIIIGIAGVVAVAVIVIGIISVRSEKDLVEERLGRYEQGYQSFLDVDEDGRQLQEGRAYRFGCN